MTLFDGPRAFVVQSNFTSKKRQASDLAHELAHILLRHDPSTISWIEGQRHFDPIAEEEAKWLGPALLISEESALWIASHQIAVAQASDLFNATEDVVRMRLNVTAALRRSRKRAA
jgi:Zn-dependent peptidase ImmA (M78 family)